MHNLHFILIRAESAMEAASEAQNQILDWGNGNNWRRIGGVASEDGSDDIENHEDGRWGLSYLDQQAELPAEGTYFDRAVAYLNQQSTLPLTHLPAALIEYSERLRGFDPQSGDGFELRSIGRDLQKLSSLITTRAARERGNEIPELWDWQFDQFGLTDMTGSSEGARRYLVFLDMHS